MTKLASIAHAFARDEQGATTAEYGVVVAVMVAIAVVVLTALHGGLTGLYAGANTQMGSAATTASGS